LPPTVQTWKFCEQVGGAVQTPFVHVSVAVQQATVPPHDCPVAAHVGPVLPRQVPLVAPGAMSQVRPEQQSAVTVQPPVSATHDARQSPPWQTVEQHCAPEVQAFPFGRHEVQVPPMQLPTQQAFAPHAWSGSAQLLGGGCVAHTQPISVTFMQVAPVQQGSGEGAEPVVEQIAPLGRHCVGGSAQRSTPVESGTQGANPQH
jgi:hypothetical protein